MAYFRLLKPSFLAQQWCGFTEPLYLPLKKLIITSRLLARDHHPPSQVFPLAPISPQGLEIGWSDVTLCDTVLLDANLVCLKSNVIVMLLVCFALKIEKLCYLPLSGAQCEVVLLVMSSNWVTTFWKLVPFRRVRISLEENYTQMNRKIYSEITWLFYS